MDPLEMPSPPPLPAPPTYISRRGWLVAFGILELVIALVFLGMGFVILLVPQEALRKAQEAQQPGAPQFPMLAFAAVYAAIATVWAVIGVGTIMAKNWARIASLVLSYFWLGSGAMGILVSALIMPAMFKHQPGLSDSQARSVLAFTLIFMGIIMVVVPAIFLIFFHNRNVKATCLAAEGGAETSRPTVMSVLIALFGLSLVCLPFNFFLSYPVVLFGALAWGATKLLVLLLFAAGEAVSLWGYLRRDLRGWWVALATSIFWVLSTLVTLSRGNISDLYQRMGLNASQMAPFETHSFLMLTWIFAVCYAGGRLLAIIYSKRYFLPPISRGQSEVTV